VGLQETHGFEGDGVRPDHGPRIAEASRWHSFRQGGRTGIASRHPIVGATPRKWGVAIALEGERIVVFNAHVPAAPYQPLRIDDHDALLRDGIGTRRGGDLAAGQRRIVIAGDRHGGAAVDRVLEDREYGIEVGGGA
jgi:hypothetical protein